MAKKRKGIKQSPAAPRSTGTTCPCCGNRAELRWHGRRRQVCAECIERGVHPIERTPTDAGSILRDVVSLLRAGAVPLALAVIVVQLPLALVVGFIDEPPAMAVALYALATLVGTGAAIEVALQVVDGEKGDVISAYRAAIRKWLGMIAGTLFAQLTVLFFLLLLVVPGIVWALSYAIVLPLIIDGEAHGIDALQLSRRRMKGHRMRALVAFGVALVPSALHVVVYVLIATGLTGMDAANLMLAPLVGQQLPDYPDTLQTVDAIDTLLYPLFDLPFVLVSVVLHVKLRGHKA